MKTDAISSSAADGVVVEAEAVHVDDGQARRRTVRRRRAGSRRFALVVATRLAVLVAIFGSWELCVRAGWVDPFFYGQPSEMFRSLWHWMLDGSLFRNTWATLYEAAVGYLLAIAAAVPLGMFLARSRFWGDVMQPFIDLANSTPRFALAPLFALLFGLGQTTKVVLVISVVFFVMLINTIAGVQSIDDNYVKLAQLVNASRIQMFLKVILPATGEWLVAGMRLSAPYALAAAVVGEMISASKGLGFLVVKYAGLLQTSQVLAAVLVLALCGWALNRISTLIALRSPWMRGTRSGR